MKRILFVLIGLALIVSACQPKAEGPQISVEDAWGRASPPEAPAAAFYMTLRNTGSEDDTLISVMTPACGIVELHESFMNADGTMAMRPVEGGIPIPAGGSAELKAGGIHIMCMDKMAAFQAGDLYTLILTFEKSGALAVEVEIRETE